MGHEQIKTPSAFQHEMPSTLCITVCKEKKSRWSLRQIIDVHRRWLGALQMMRIMKLNIRSCTSEESRIVMPEPVVGATVELAFEPDAEVMVEPGPDVSGTAEAVEEPGLLVDEPSAGFPGSSGDGEGVEDASLTPEVVGVAATGDELLLDTVEELDGTTEVDVAEPVGAFAANPGPVLVYRRRRIVKGLVCAYLFWPYPNQRRCRRFSKRYRQQAIGLLCIESR